MIATLLLPSCGCSQPRLHTKGRDSAKTSQPIKKYLEHDGRKRSYLVHLPKQYTHNSAYPLLLALHGRHGKGKDQAKLSGFDSLSDKYGFIAVYPDGVGRSWNAGHGTGKAERLGVDDVAFIGKLIDVLSEKYQIDKNRVYAAGMSNGGVFAHRLGCELAHRVTAIADVAGSIAPKVAAICNPTRQVPVMIFHGTADKIVPFNGGKTKGGGMLLAVRETAHFWRQKNKLPDKTQVIYDRGKARCESSSSAAGKVAVVLCTIKGGGHTWPGGHQYAPRIFVGVTNRDINASEMIWGFFSNYSIH